MRLTPFTCRSLLTSTLLSSVHAIPAPGKLDSTPAQNLFDGALKPYGEPLIGEARKTNEAKLQTMLAGEEAARNFNPPSLDDSSAEIIQLDTVPDSIPSPKAGTT